MLEVINKFKNDLKNINIELTESSLDSFNHFYNELVKENENINLTRITDISDVYNLHFYDSLYALTVIDKNNISKVLDIGSGAGFPGLPISIVSKNIKLTSVDAVNKKINFQNRMIKELNLVNAKAIHSRLEDFKEYNSYDYCLSRAISSLKKQIPLSLPFLKEGGILIAFKGENKAQEEIDEAKDLLIKYNARVIDIKKYNCLDRSYCLVLIKKEGKSPEIIRKQKKEDLMIIREGDILELKKPHPCGENKWIVKRSGVDCKIECLGCGHELMIDRIALKKSIKSFLSHRENN